MIRIAGWSRRLPVSLLALIEQASVSATNFVVGLILARELGLEVFGWYSIGFVAVILAMYLHGALCALPMMTIAPSIEDPAARSLYLGRVCALQLLISLLTLLLLGLSVPLAAWWLEGGWLIWFLAVCAVGTVPFAEWFRRYLYAVGSLLAVVFFSILRGILSVAALLGLVLWDSLTLEGAFVVLVGGALLPLFLFALFGGFSPLIWNGLSGVFRRNWQIGRHMLPAGLLEWFNLQGFLLLAAGFLGPVAIGAIRAAQNIVGPLSIVSQAIENVLPVKGAEALAVRGVERARAYFWRSGSALILGLLPLCLLIGFWSEELMGLVYGQELSVFYGLVILQLASLLLGVIYKVCSAVLRVFELTRPLLRAALTRSVIFVVLLIGYGESMSASGVMVAKLTSELLSLSVLGVALRRVTQAEKPRTKLG